MTSQLRGLAVLLTLLALLAGSAVAAAEPTPTYTKEDLSQYESQLKAGEVQSVIVNKRERSLRVTLKDGTHVFAKYGKKEGPKYYAAITAKKIPLTFLSPAAAKAEQEHASKHHKLRYIAGGVLIVVIVIAVVILLVRRRRPDED
ncbi:MAG TPA: hypothetical protein VMB91_08470 [Solirubrobacteraceae bacterium]|nr:hypothetical protein [Solirubrobacteraceae bacterium]